MSSGKYADSVIKQLKATRGLDPHKPVEGSKMQSTEFLTLEDALAGRQIKRIYARRIGSRTGRPIHPQVSLGLVDKLMRLGGELYAERWAASQCNSRALGYETILVDFEE